MTDSLNLKKCFFCGLPSFRKMVLDPQNVLRDIYLNASYAGCRYPVCQACAATWDTQLNKINETHKKEIDNLFESMIVNKGAFSAKP